MKLMSVIIPTAINPLIKIFSNLPMTQNFQYKGIIHISHTFSFNQGNVILLWVLKHNI